MKQSGYFIVHDFMQDQLGLGGFELLVYALIYSFSHDGGVYNGSLAYLCRRTGCSRPTAIRVLQSLVKKGLLRKTGGAAESAPNQYRVINTRIKMIPPPSQNDTGTGKKMIPPPSQNDTAPRIKMIPNNKENNKEDNKCDNGDIWETVGLSAEDLAWLNGESTG